MSVLMNDVHSQLNPTWVDQVHRPETVGQLQKLLTDASSTPISISGGRHAMGGQQFGSDTLHVDTRGLDRVLSMDVQRGHVTAEAGIQWPALIDQIRSRDRDGDPQWAIRQKQTGASDLTLGGALAANVHGRGLRMKPIIDDVESFTLLDATGEPRVCSRACNPEWFRHVIGGYGLFGLIVDVTLRLSPRQRVQRCVDVCTVDEIISRFDEEIQRGTLYGDFQFAIDHLSDDFLHRGVFSRYRPVDPSTPIPDSQIYFDPDKWLQLIRLARTDRSEAYRQYVSFYQSTAGQIYDSDTHQLSTYVPRYHDRLGELPEAACGTEVISELYVPRDRLPQFMQESAQSLRHHGAPVTYGTVRLIQQDQESMLNWAKQDYACVIFNLLTSPGDRGRQRTADAFVELYDRALAMQGCFYLTYHAFAQGRQIEQAYPQVRDFLEAKMRWDPEERFQSDWYRYLKQQIG